MGVSASRARSSPKITQRAFTLLELLVVIAIIGVLASVILSGGWRASQDDKVMRARAELSVIRVALEEFRRVYGDYPHVASDSTQDGFTAGQDLFAALDGWRGSLATGITFPTKRKSFVDHAAHVIRREAADESSAACLLDPWGNAYRYLYQPGAGWTRSGYLLFSKGEDGLTSLPLPSGGLLDDTYGAIRVNARAVNADNILPADND